MRNQRIGKDLEGCSVDILQKYGDDVCVEHDVQNGEAQLNEPHVTNVDRMVENTISRPEPFR